MQAFELELGRLQLGLQHFAQRVDASLGAFLLDGHQAVREGLLLARGVQFAVDRLQLNVGRRRIQCHLFKGILQAE